MSLGVPNYMMEGVSRLKRRAQVWMNKKDGGGDEDGG